MQGVLVFAGFEQGSFGFAGFCRGSRLNFGKDRGVAFQGYSGHSPQSPLTKSPV